MYASKNKGVNVKALFAYALNIFELLALTHNKRAGTTRYNITFRT